MASSGRRPHLLYVAWGYPPCRGGGVYRALATPNAFAAAGWDVTVLTVEREVWLRYTGADTTLEERIHPSITVERIPFSWPALETDVRRYSALRVYAPGVWRRARKQLDTLPFPEPGYGPWRRELEPAAERIHARKPVDLTLATANPHVTFAAAWRLHREHGVPYVMDYRDAWLLDVFSGDRLFKPESRAARWEQRLIAGAREVWFVNEPIRAWHAELYQSHAHKMHVVANGFDPDLIRSGGHHEDAPDRPLTFGYIGTVSGKVPLAEFVEGWREARSRSDLVRRAKAEIHGYLGFYSTPRADLARLVDDAAADGVHYLGPVPKTAVRSVYNRFDALLLILGTGRYVTSGKVYEYLATGLPIVSVHDPGNAASDVLRGYPRWFPVPDLSASSIADALTAAADAAQEADVATRERCWEFAERYSREHQLGPRVAALGRSIAGLTSAGAA